MLFHTMCDIREVSFLHKISEDSTLMFKLWCYTIPDLYCEAAVLVYETSLWLWHVNIEQLVWLTASGWRRIPWNSKTNTTISVRGDVWEASPRNKSTTCCPIWLRSLQALWPHVQQRGEGAHEGVKISIGNHSDRHLQTGTSLQIILGSCTCSAVLVEIDQ